VLGTIASGPGAIECASRIAGSSLDDARLSANKAAQRCTARSQNSRPLLSDADSASELHSLIWFSKKTLISSIAHLKQNAPVQGAARQCKNADRFYFVPPLSKKKSLMHLASFTTKAAPMSSIEQGGRSGGLSEVIHPLGQHPINFGHECP
jgi:hypothetical protein